MDGLYFEAPIPRKSHKRWIKDILSGKYFKRELYLSELEKTRVLRRSIWRTRKRRILPFRRRRRRRHRLFRRHHHQLEQNHPSKLGTVINYMNHTNRAFWYAHRIGHKFHTKPQRRVFFTLEW